MAALCLPFIADLPDEAGLSKAAFLNTWSNLDIPDLLSDLVACAEVQYTDPRNVAGDCRRRKTPSAAISPPSKSAGDGSSQRRPRREGPPDNVGSGSGNGGENNDKDGAGDGGRSTGKVSNNPRQAVADTEMNKYWIPSIEIHQKVLYREIEYYLGPKSTVKSYEYEGEDGFLITTPGECLTDEQIDDICLKSKQVWDAMPASRLKRPLHKPIVITGKWAVNGRLTPSCSEDTEGYTTRIGRQSSDFRKETSFCSLARGAHHDKFAWSCPDPSCWE